MPATKPAPPSPNGSVSADTRQITFAGRTLTVGVPTAEQLAVWQRTARRMSAANTEAITGAEAMKLLDRGLRVIQSVLVDDADRDWLEDELLDGNLTLEEAAQIVTDAIAAFGEAAPKTGPVKKARRAR